jgi:hypothetical protein
MKMAYYIQTLMDKELNLKGNLFAFLLLILCSNSIWAQHSKHNISVGIGFPNIPRFYFNQFNYKTSFSSTGTGPYHLKYENKINSRFGLGASINYMAYQVSYNELIFDTTLGTIANNKTTIKSNNLAINARVNYHLLDPIKHPKTAFYVGFGVGYRIGRFTTESDFPSNTVSITLPNIYRLGLESTIGWRQKIYKQSSFYLEMGPAKSVIQAGINIGINQED